MFSFKEELAKYRESLPAQEVPDDLSGDETQDIYDIAQALAQKLPEKDRRQS